jgi:hypothetical protein
MHPIHHSELLSSARVRRGTGAAVLRAEERS